MVHNLESYVYSLLDGILAQTETLAFGTVFFFLYLVLLLFVPVHINSHRGMAKTFTMLPWNPANSKNHHDEEDHHDLTEFQDLLYNVIWNYCLTVVVINAIYFG